MQKFIVVTMGRLIIQQLGLTKSLRWLGVVASAWTWIFTMAIYNPVKAWMIIRIKPNRNMLGPAQILCKLICNNSGRREGRCVRQESDDPLGRKSFRTPLWLESQRNDSLLPSHHRLVYPNRLAQWLLSVISQLLNTLPCHATVRHSESLGTLSSFQGKPQ